MACSRARKRFNFYDRIRINLGRFGMCVILMFDGVWRRIKIVLRSVQLKSDIETITSFVVVFSSAIELAQNIETLSAIKLHQPNTHIHDSALARETF